MTIYPRLLLATGLLCTLGQPSLTLAEAERNLALEEVVVTAQKRAESLQDTPISIAAFGDAELEKLGVTNLADVQYNVPNLNMRQFPNSQSALRIFIRGIGNNDVQVSQDPAVGVYVDGLYVARSSGLASELVDPERIEILRGPQGTLYGRNTTGGAINIVPRAPGEEFSLRQTLGVGNYSRRRSRTDINLPLIDGMLSAKLGYAFSERDGWVENQGAGPNFGDERKRGARIALRFTPSAHLTVDYAYDHTDNRSGVIYYQTIAAPNPGYEDVPWSAGFQDSTTPSHPMQSSTLEIEGHSLIANWDIGADTTLKSLTGYRELDEHIYQDYSANPNTPRLFANDPFDTRHDQFSQELQLIGELADTGLNYVAGLYYFDESGAEFTTDFISLATTTLTGVPLPPELLVLPLIEGDIGTRHTRAYNSAWAVYGQATWTPAWLDRRLHLTVGLRQSWDEREIKGDRENGFWGALFGGEDYSNVQADKRFSNFSPSYTAAFDISDEISTYAKYVKGYKTGGFNSRAATRAGLVTPFAEELVTTTELGLKSQWLDSRLRLNVALFDSAYEDIQLSFAPTNNPSDPTFFNAGKASISGLEADLVVLLAEGLRLTVNYAMLDASVDEVVNPNTGVDEGDEYELPSAPEESYTLDLTYTRPLGKANLLLNANYSWRDSVWPAAKTTETPNAEIDAYGLWSARAALDFALGTAGALEVAAWGKNLQDEEYQLDIIGAFPWSTRVGAFGEPRSYGLDVTYRY